MDRPHDPAYNRDEQSRPGRPPRMAQDSGKAKGATRSPKTQTDPASGEHQPGAPEPNTSHVDERAGVKRERP
jgi:hypothetical protein